MISVWNGEAASFSEERQRGTLHRFRFLMTMICCTLTAACSQYGPVLVREGRNDYNIAVRQTSDEQVLLNLVRLRYADNPFWLEVGSVTTQFNVSRGPNTQLDISEFLDYGWRIGADVRYSETPTISYTPVSGEQFVRNILRPMDFDIFLLLANSGWDVDDLLRLTASRINGLPNAPNAEGSVPRKAPKFEGFNRAAVLLREMQERDVLRFRFQDPGNETRPTMYIKQTALDWPEVEEFRGLLGLKEKRRLYDLHIIADKPNPDSIGIDFRSLAEIIQFLSTSVDVPARDLDAGRAMVTVDENGRRFDWSRVTGDLFDIRSTEEQPEDAAVAVYYRGAWFYIDDTDLTTKNTFRLLNFIGSILAGKTEQKPAPVLTLPVGGG